MKFDLSAVKLLFQNSIKIVVGIFLIVLGVIGLFVPLLQGILLIAVGLIVLGNKYIIAKFTLCKKALYRWWS